MTGTAHAQRLPRHLHPAAWWAWALGMATVASLTTNPVLLLLVLAVVTTVVVARRSDAPWAKGLRTYLWLAAVIVGIRLVFRVLLGSGSGQTILFTLPAISLPEATGIRLGGPVSLEGLLAAAYDGLRLASLIVCIGAAQLLADPKRLLRSAPAGLYQIGTTIVVALAIAPQLVASLQRVRLARRLRGDESRGLRAMRSLLMPVLEDALDRSIALAAAMDSRGYGRTAHLPTATQRRTGVLLLAGLGGVCIGTYGVLDATGPPVLGLPMLLVGAATAVAGMTLAGRQVPRTVYRPDRWLPADRAVALLGALAALTALVTARLDPQSLHPTFQPLQWPALPLLVAAGIILAVLPAVVAPPVPVRIPRVTRTPSAAPADGSREQASGQPSRPAPVPLGRP